MRLSVIFLVLLQISVSASAQHKVVINGTFQNIPAKEISIRSAARSFFFDHFKQGRQNVSFRDNQFKLEVDISSPVIRYLLIETDSQYYQHPLFLAPGYSLTLKLDLDEQNNMVIVSARGIGAKDNQSLLIKSDMNLAHFNKRKDSLPDALFAFIKDETKKDSISLDTYIRKYKPSAAFKEAWQLNIKYSTLKNFHNFSENWKFAIGESYYRNIAHWEKIKSELLAQSPLVNEKALRYDAPNYASFIRVFVGRQKEKLWKEAARNSKNLNPFITEWYGTDFEAGLLAYREDPENLLQQKIVDRYFTGATREYNYVLIIEKALAQSNPNNLQRIYNKLLSSYPNTKYKKMIDPALQTVFKKMENTLNPNMVFIDRSDTLTSFEQVLSHIKGETVLLDMWGTWCAPCREEFDKNLPVIKSHFSKKGLKYMYIANGDLGKEKKWKELISYFKLEGYHILANDTLTQDIMSKVKGEGYPTYVIIKRDGTFEKYKAGYPISREQLIKQVEEALE